MQFMFQAVVSCRTLNGAREDESQSFFSFLNSLRFLIISDRSNHPYVFILTWFIFVDSFAIICRGLTLNLMLEEIDSIYKIGFLKQNLGFTCF